MYECARFCDVCKLTLVIALFCNLHKTVGNLTCKFEKLENSDDSDQDSGLQEHQTSPSARGGSATWCDDSGIVWIFGGVGHDDVDHSRPQLLNDLWLYNSNYNQWKLINSGSNHSLLSSQSELVPPTQQQGLLSSSTSRKSRTPLDNATSVVHQKSVPLPRRSAHACGVPGNVLVIFGGVDINGTHLSDTWLFNMQSKVWVPFDRQADIRKEDRPFINWTTAASWCVNNRNLYILQSCHPDQAGNHTNAFNYVLWRFCLRSLAWTQVTQHTVVPFCSSSLVPQTDECSVITGTWNRNLYMHMSWQENAEKRERFLWFSFDNHTWISQATSGDKKTMPWITMSTLWSEPTFGGMTEDTKISNNCLTVAYNPLFNNLTVDDEQNLHCASANEIKRPNPRVCANTWLFRNKIYIFGGLMFNGHGKVSFFKDIWSLTVASQLSLPQHQYFLRSTVYLAVLVCIGAVPMLFAFGFCVRRTYEFYYGRSKSRTLNIRYTPLRDRALFE